MKTLRGALIVIGRIVIADEFTQDFRDRQFDEASLRIVGSQKLVIREREGLRVVIKAEPGASDAGVKFPMQLMGDCRMEAAVELIDVPNPKGGYGTGVAMLLEDGGTSGASFQYVVMPDGNHLYVAHKYVRDDDGKYKHEAQTFPAPASNSVMKMERHGGQLTYSVSEDDGDFRELAHYPFTTDPILVAQVYGQLGGQPNVLDIRITNFEVEAETFVRAGETPREQGSVKNIAGRLA